MNRSPRFTIIVTAVVLLVLVFSVVRPINAYADDATPAAPAATQPADTSAPATQAPAVTDTSAPATQAPAATDTTVAPVDTSAPATSAASTDTTVAPVDTSAPATTAASTDTSVAPTDTTAAATEVSSTDTDAPTLTSEVPTGTPIVVVDSTGTVVPLATATAAAIVSTGDPIFCLSTASTIAALASGCTDSYSNLSDLVTYLSSNQPTGDGTIWIEQGSDSSASAVSINGGSLTTWAPNKLTLQGAWDNSTTNGTVTSTPSSFSVPISITNWGNDVTLNDINITNPTGDGLTVTEASGSTGNITVHHVNSSHNINNNGAQLDNSSGTGSISVDNSTFNGNAGYGLIASSNGDITLNNVTASNNTHAAGAQLDNSSGSGSISLTGTNYFSNNGADGLDVYSNGDITLTNVTADDNGGDGAFLNNALLDPTITNSQFDGNSANGLEVRSSGDVTLTKVTADYNNYDGALLGNSSFDGDVRYYDEIGGNISVSSSDFSNNQGNGYCDSDHFSGCSYDPAGLEAYADGSISLSGVTAEGNSDYGTYLNNIFNDNGVSISNSTFDSNTSSGAQTGLDIHTDGVVNLNSISASNNLGGDGTDVNGSDPFGSFTSLSIENSTFNDNYSIVDDWGWGLFAESGIGNVTLLNVTASGNSSGGGTSGGMFIQTSGSIFVDPSTFNGNDGNGLKVSSGSNITVDCSGFENNSGYGINAALPGTLTLNSVTLSGNTLGSTNITGGGTLVTNSVNCNPGHGKSGGGLPLNIINVTGGEGNALDCTDYSGTELVLPDQDHAILPCPISQTGIITGKTSSNLPGTLDSKFTFVSGFDVEVNPSLTGMMTVSFKIPSGKEGAHFTILHWDGTKWVNLGGSINPPGFFSVDTNLTGEFVLVTQ